MECIKKIPNWGKAVLKVLLWLSVAVVVICIIPYIINCLILKHSQFDIVGDGSHWLSFWASYLATIASFVMIFFTWRTLKEMQRQWTEINRARLTFAIVAYDGVFLLKITNCGTATAYNITINFNKDFIDKHFSSKIKETLQSLSSKPFCIEAGVSKYYYISPTYTDGFCKIGDKETYTGEQINQWLDENKSNKIVITGRYCCLFNIKEEFSIDEYINGGIIVKDELTLAVERIKKGVIVQNDQYYPIQKSLDIIANSISKKQY